MRTIETICGGVIQGSSNARFCCKDASHCTIKGHKTKVNLRNDTLYVKHTRAGQAQLVPLLPVKWLPADTTLNEMLNKELSWTVWAAHFGSIAANQDAREKRSGLTYSGEGGSPWEEVEIPTLDTLAAAS